MEQIQHTTTLRAPKLTTLTAWSAEHIKTVFEAETDEECIHAIDTTFSRRIAVTLNGNAHSFDEIKHLVLSMRKAAQAGLSVEWQQAVEAPQDPNTNRDGVFAGFYIIRGVRKQLPGMSRPGDFERHKNVSVKIESESSDPNVDSRRIVQLIFVAVDVRVERQASL